MIAVSARAHRSLAHGELGANMAMRVAGAVRLPIGAEAARLHERVGVTAVSFHSRYREAYIGAKLGSATMTSWPRFFRWRATHSLFVLASRRIRARRRSPSTAVNRSRRVAIRRSWIVPSSLAMHSWLSRLCKLSPIMVIGWPPVLVCPVLGR